MLELVLSISKVLLINFDLANEEIVSIVYAPAIVSYFDAIVPISS